MKVVDIVRYSHSRARNSCMEVTNRTYPCLRAMEIAPLIDGRNVGDVETWRNIKSQQRFRLVSKPCHRLCLHVRIIRTID